MNPDSVENYTLFNRTAYHMLGDKGVIFERSHEFMKDVKIFNLDENSEDLILQTKNKIFYREVPFNKMFITNSFGFEYYSGTVNIVKGILLFKQDDKLYLNFMLELKDQIVPMSLCYNFDELSKVEYILTSKDESPLSYSKSTPNKEILKRRMSAELLRIVCNLLDFLNHPKTERVEIEYSKEENQKRISRGKLPYPSSVCIVRLDNVIKQYVGKSKGEHKEFSHKFWVRGHYIHFRNKNRFRYLYNLTYEQLKEKGYQEQNELISKFINSFIKGKGKLYNKRYEVKT